MDFLCKTEPNSVITRIPKWNQRRLGTLHGPALDDIPACAIHSNLTKETPMSITAEEKTRLMKEFATKEGDTCLLYTSDAADE